MFGIANLFDSQDLIDAILIMVLGITPSEGLLAGLFDGLLGELIYTLFNIPNGANILDSLGGAGSSFL